MLPSGLKCRNCGSVDSYKVVESVVDSKRNRLNLRLKCDVCGHRRKSRKGLKSGLNPKLCYAPCSWNQRGKCLLHKHVIPHLGRCRLSVLGLQK